jgi:putative intracellular protease/amidase
MSLKDPNLVNRQSPKRVAIVISNPAVSMTTGRPVGFWWSELAHPYLCFREKGYQVRGFAVRDGNLVTGQQNFSGTETAELVVRALGE